MANLGATRGHVRYKTRYYSATLQVTPLRYLVPINMKGMSWAGWMGSGRIIRLDQVISTLIDVDAVESK
jgi:hypothetical protein